MISLKIFEALSSANQQESRDQTRLETKDPLKVINVKKVRDRAYHYSHRHRGNWFKPEYDFDVIQIAQDTDSYLFRALKKKTDRFFLAGWQFVSENADSLNYVKSRIAEIEMATNTPFRILIMRTVSDMFRYSNAMWAKTRDSKRSSGKVRVDISKATLEPVAGYHLLPFETLHFKTRSNGEIKKIMQKLPDGTKKEFFPSDIIHFYCNKKPGFSVGTPEIFPALDDIALLRRIEENVEELIETNLFPVYHYKVGSDQFPERYTPEGEKETELIKRTIEYMPTGGIYVSDHRHEVEAIGSESKALRIDFYLSYFKARVFAALGVSPIDMGEGSSGSRSTASTLSKGMMMDIEAMQEIMKVFLEFFVINELLLEGGFNPLDTSMQVKVQFGVIDKEERIALENQQIQLFSNKLVTQTQARNTLGWAPLTEEEHEDTYFTLYEEPLALIRAMGAGTAASETLGEVPTSSVTPAAVNKEKAYAKAAEKAKASGKVQGRPTSRSSSSGQRSASTSRSRPSNQHGTRSAPKLNRDVDLTEYLESFIIALNPSVSDEKVEDWKQSVLKRYEEFVGLGISIDAMIKNMLPNLQDNNGL